MKNWLHSNSDWSIRWEKRAEAVRRVFGETIPSGSVAVFEWSDYVLPGACALTFSVSDGSSQYLRVSLGLTHPVERGDSASPWEFAVRANELAAWQLHLIYDLLTHWLSSVPEIGRGYFLPLLFFKRSEGQTACGLVDESYGAAGGLQVIGSMRGLYLWDDLYSPVISAPSGPFRLMTAVSVTKAEDELAQATTPPHLLLALQQLGVYQTTSRMRDSIRAYVRFERIWARIQAMSHDNVVKELERLRVRHSGNNEHGEHCV